MKPVLKMPWRSSPPPPPPPRPPPLPSAPKRPLDSVSGVAAALFEVYGIDAATPPPHHSAPPLPPLHRSPPPRSPLHFGGPLPAQHSAPPPPPRHRPSNSAARTRQPPRGPLQCGGPLLAAEPLVQHAGLPPALPPIAACRAPATPLSSPGGATPTVPARKPRAAAQFDGGIELSGARYETGWRSSSHSTSDNSERLPTPSVPNRLPGTRDGGGGGGSHTNLPLLLPAAPVLRPCSHAPRRSSVTVAEEGVQPQHGPPGATTEDGAAAASGVTQTPRTRAATEIAKKSANPGGIAIRI